MPTRLYSTVPVRTRRTFLMLLGSVAVHGLTVAAASFWIVQPAIPVTLPPTEVSLLPSPDGPQLENLPVSAPTFAPPLSALPEPPAPDDPLIPPPPTFDPELTEPPVSVSTPSPRRTSRPLPSTHSVHGTPASGQSAAAPHGPSTAEDRAVNGLGAGHPGSGGLWKASKPPYPYALRAARVQGSGSLRVTTDAAGHVVQAALVQSSGSTALDDNICRYARGFWSGPANSTTTIPFTYQLP